MELAPSHRKNSSMLRNVTQDLGVGRIAWRAVEYTVMNLLVPQKANRVTTARRALASQDVLCSVETVNTLV
jgi:hypothetical protein